MDRSEKREIRRQKKLLNKRRKKYAAEERESVRRLNRELRQKATAHRKKLRKARLEALKNFFRNIINPFNKAETKEPEKIPQQLFKEFSGPEEQIRRKHKGKGYDSFFSSKPKIDEEEKRKLKERKKLFKKRRKEYISGERRSIKKERLEMRKGLIEMRRKITVARIEGYKNDFIKFIKNPIHVEKVRGADKLLRDQVKHDIKRQNILRIKQFPGELKNSIFRFWSHKFDQFRNMRRNASGFAGLVAEAWRVKSLRDGYLRTILNSSVFFILTFLLVYYVYQFTTIYAAKAFDIPSKLYTYRIEWPLYTYSYLYTRVALIVIFGTGPLVCLILAFIFYRLYIWSRTKAGNIKLIFLWGGFHAFNLFFGSYISGVLTRTGFIYTSEWLFISNIFDVEEIIFMIIAIVVLLVIGYFATKQFLYAAGSTSLIVPRYRTLFILSQVVIPWLAGNIILFLSNVPKNPVELTLLYITSVLMVIPVLAGYNSTSLQQFSLPHVPDKLKLGWTYLILLAILMTMLKIVLKEGLSFI
jgi:hypothetical protein